MVTLTCGFGRSAMRRDGREYGHWDDGEWFCVLRKGWLGSGRRGVDLDGIARWSLICVWYIMWL